MTHALLFNRSCTRLSAHQPSTATAWTFFQIPWTDSGLIRKPQPNSMDDRLRQPVFLEIREDKNPNEVGSGEGKLKT
jgi:hypothetical protein